MIEVVNFGSTMPVHFSKKSKNDVVRSTGRNDVNISNALSVSSSNVAKATLNMNKAKTPSFKGTFYKFPGAFGTGSDSYFSFEHNYSEQGPSLEKAKEYAKDHPGDFIGIYDAKLRINGMYGYPEGKIITNLGGMYIEKDGSLTSYYNGDIQKITKDPKTSEYKSEDKIIIGLAADGRKQEAVVFADKYEPEALAAQKAIAKICLEQGRYDEASARFPELQPQLDEAVNNIRYLYTPVYNVKKPQTINDRIASGDIRGVLKEYGKEALPYPLSTYDEYTLKNVLDFFEENESLESWVENSKSRAKKNASGVFDSSDLLERLVNAMFTLGITEVVNIATREYDRLSSMSFTNKRIANTRSIITDMLAAVHDAKLKQIEIQKQDAFFMHKIEEQKEPIKAELSSRFVFPLVQAQKGESVDLPNCVMLTGENPYVMQELIDWTAELSDVNYVKIPASDYNSMQKWIYSELDKAEEHYKTTGERSIIFVNGMEKLLNPEMNSKKNIAALKDVMSSADEDYHSTIMFYAQNPEALDKGTMVFHRVGLKVNVPISVDSKIYEKIEG